MSIAGHVGFARGEKVEIEAKMERAGGCEVRWGDLEAGGACQRVYPQDVNERLRWRALLACWLLREIASVGQTAAKKTVKCETGTNELTASTAKVGTACFLLAKIA